MLIIYYFRDIIDKHLSKRPEITRFQDKDKLIPPLFSKEITFKFLYQVLYFSINSIFYVFHIGFWP